MSGIPSDDQIRALHERFAPSAEAFDQVYTHSLAVCAVAEQLLDRLGADAGIDADLARAGCLLHDIGVYRLGDRSYVEHGVVGHTLLEQAGLPELLCRFCSHHTGVGITRDDVLRQGLSLPVADYLAETPEERLVMYADKFHTKSTPPTFVSAGAFEAAVSRFGADKPARFATLVKEFGEPELEVLAGRFGHELR